MGRTVPTWRGRFERSIESLLPYRRALRKQDRPAFDSMLQAARDRRAAGGMLVGEDPLQVMLLSMLLAAWRDLKEVERRLAQLQHGLEDGP